MQRYLFTILLLFAISTSVNANPITVLQDNFNDGSIADWDQNAGTWSGANFDLNGGNLDGGTISHAVVMPSGNDYNISFQARTDASVTNLEISWFTDQNGSANMNGYQIVLQSGITLFRKKVNGANTNIKVASGISTGVIHDVNIFVRGPLVVLVIDDVQIFSATDSTYNTGSKFVFTTAGTANNYAIDNVNITRNSSTAVTITVLRPIDEKTLLPVDGNWTAKLTDGNYSDFQDANNSSKVFVGTKGSSIVNSFIIDDSNAFNDIYLARHYELTFNVSDANTFTLQPYLIKITDGILVNIKVIDIPTNLTIPNLRVNLKKGINGNVTLVESKITDALGIAQVVELSQQDYQLEVLSLSNDINYFSGITSPVTQTVTIAINYSNSNIVYDKKTIFVSYFPKGNTIVGSGLTQQIDFNVSTNFDINSIMVQAIDRNIVRNQVVSTSNPFNSSLTITLNQFDSNYVIFKITVSSLDNNTIIPKTYLIVGANQSGAIGLRNINSTLTNISIACFVIMLMLGAIFFLGQGSLGNSDAQIFPVAILGGVLFYIFLPELILYFMGGLIAGGFAWMWARSTR